MQLPPSGEYEEKEDSEDHNRMMEDDEQLNAMERKSKKSKREERKRERSDSHSADDFSNKRNKVDEDQHSAEDGGEEGSDDGKMDEEDEVDRLKESRNEKKERGGHIHTNTTALDRKQQHGEDTESETVQLTVEEFELGHEIDLAEARNSWMKYRYSTDSYSTKLCEQLRLILEPTLASRLQGDYRTGKRINMRKVIPFVASGFRKDKIWLRRTKPAKRDYQVMVMIDDSSSMDAAGPMALSALSIIANALTKLEIGQFCVTSFSDTVEIVHPFGKQFNDEAGSKVCAKFKFDATKTMLGSSLEAMMPIFDNAKALSTSSNTASVVLQLCFVISDARIDSDNRERLDNIIKTMSEKNILVVLVIIDHNENPKDSIFNTKMVSFRGDKVVTSSYFDEFPFPYYVAIQKLEALPDVLSDALKQWFELIRGQLSNN